MCVRVADAQTEAVQAASYPRHLSDSVCSAEFSRHDAGHHDMVDEKQEQLSSEVSIAAV